MNKISKDNLINMLHTNASKESLRKSIRIESIRNFARTVLVTLYQPKNIMLGILMVSLSQKKILMKRQLMQKKHMKP